MGNTNCYPIAINDKGVTQENSLTTDYYDENGSPVTTASTASCVFMHELLDEFLNTIINKEITPKSPNIEKVCYKNAALRNIGLLERNGADYDYLKKILIVPQPYCRQAVAKEQAYPRHTQRIRVERGKDMPRV